MKKLLLIVLFSISGFCFAQKGTEHFYRTPTIVIDGVLMEERSTLQYLLDSLGIGIDDIEDISILKDASGSHTIISCGSSPNGVIVITTKEKFDIIVTDSGYDSFLAGQQSKETYSLAYLKSHNCRFVTTWNNRCYNTGQLNSDIYDMPVNYEPNRKYDLNLEYKLYMYFRFIEYKNKIRLS